MLLPALIVVFPVLWFLGVLYWAHKLHTRHHWSIGGAIAMAILWPIMLAPLRDWTRPRDKA